MHPVVPAKNFILAIAELQLSAHVCLDVEESMNGRSTQEPSYFSACTKHEPSFVAAEGVWLGVGLGVGLGPFFEVPIWLVVPLSLPSTVTVILSFALAVLFGRVEVESSTGSQSSPHHDKRHKEEIAMSK